MVCEVSSCECAESHTALVMTFCTGIAVLLCGVPTPTGQTEERVPGSSPKIPGEWKVMRLYIQSL